MIIKEWDNLFSIDFTGGYSMNLTLSKVHSNDKPNYKEAVEKALLNSGISKGEMKVKELSPSNNLRIFLSSNLDNEGKPLNSLKQYDSLAYDENVRAHWVVDALQKHKISISPESIKHVNESWESIGAQTSKDFQKKAILGTILSIIFIISYLSFRFELPFAISAAIGIIFDITLIISFVGILSYLSFIQVDSGVNSGINHDNWYSLNDTIVVFDRIREHLKENKNSRLSTICNLSLNSTLSRTMMTSLTTLMVVLSMIIFGGNSIFSFSLVMGLGIVIGTISTLFVVPKVLRIFSNQIMSGSMRKASSESRPRIS